MAFTALAARMRPGNLGRPCKRPCDPWRSSALQLCNAIHGCAYPQTHVHTRAHVPTMTMFEISTNAAVLRVRMRLGSGITCLSLALAIYLAA